MNHYLLVVSTPTIARQTSVSHIVSKLILPIEKPFEYDITLPGSKSIALRQLLISALAFDDSTLLGIPPCDDVDAMLDCLERLGTRISGSLEDGLQLTPNFNSDAELELDARQSGVSLRLLLAAASLRQGVTRFSGRESLANRPNNALLDAITGIGCVVESNDGKLPITISSAPTNNASTLLDATLSSQYLSALLIVGPCFPQGLEVQLIDRLASASYVAGTIGEIEKRGVEIEQHMSDSIFRMRPQTYQGGRFDIEGDASAATYHMALATLHGGTVELTNVGQRSWQPDYRFVDVCAQLGAEIEQHDHSTVVRGPSELKPLDTVDMSAMPDAAPTLMAIAPYLPQPVKISGLSTLRHKECDRIACPARELSRAGVRVEEGADYLKIWPSKPKPTTFDTYDDHRMAMSFSVLASKTDGCRINDPMCVNKTYTNYWRDMSLAYV